MPKHLSVLKLDSWVWLWTLQIVVQNQMYVKHVLLKLESEIPSYYNLFKYVRSETRALQRENVLPFPPFEPHSMSAVTFVPI